MEIVATLTTERQQQQPAKGTIVTITSEMVKTTEGDGTSHRRQECRRRHGHLSHNTGHQQSSPPLESADDSLQGKRLHRLPDVV